MGATAHPRDRITRIRIQNFRSLADVTLDLDGLSVLIGDNGSGKSSIVEAIETLRYFADPGATVAGFFQDHVRPVRGDLGSFTLGVSIENEGDLAPLRYQFGIFHHGQIGIGVDSECLDVGPVAGAAQPLHAIQRSPRGAQVFDQASRKLVEVPTDPHRLLCSALSSVPTAHGTQPPQQQAASRVVAALRNIEVHVPFEVMPAWAARRMQRKSASREASLLQPARRLELLAANLGNVYHSLKNDYGAAHWNETMELVRLGLGKDVDDVSAITDAAGGQHAIGVRYKAVSVPAAALSDGTLAYLAFVALARLPSERTLLAFDEPELHLHPSLLTRVVSMFASISKRCPVILATHSDRVLDSLLDPAASAVLCELDEERATRLVRPDPELLRKWLTDFRGLGELRGAGLQSAVMQVREPKE